MNQLTSLESKPKHLPGFLLVHPSGSSAGHWAGTQHAQAAHLAGYWGTSTWLAAMELGALENMAAVVWKLT